MIANTNAARVPAPSSVPAVSTRAAVGSALSGRMTAATIRAASPNDQVEPEDGPPAPQPGQHAADDRAHGQREAGGAAHTPIARLRARASGYRWRSIDSVPGSLAAAPRPITARPAMSTSGVRGERAQHRAGAEHPRAGQHDLLAAELVPDHPAGQHEAGEREGVRAHHPLQVGDARLQARLDVAERDADHGVVEEGQEEQRAQRREGQPTGRRAAPPPRRAGHRRRPRPGWPTGRPCLSRPNCTRRAASRRVSA